MIARRAFLAAVPIAALAPRAIAQETVTETSRAYLRYRCERHDRTEWGYSDRAPVCQDCTADRLREIVGPMEESPEAEA